MKKALELINEGILQAMQRRAPNIVLQSQGQPRLVAVSKYQPVNSILEAYELGQRNFGENYINELFEKSNSQEILQNCSDIRWHFIGHLQKNKVNKLLKIPNLHVVETIDSKALAQLINQAFERSRRSMLQQDQSQQMKKQLQTDGSGDDRRQPNDNTSSVDDHQPRLKVMIQINTSGEETKGGVDSGEIIPLVDYIWNDCNELELCGIMTIGKLGGWPDDDAAGPNKDFISLYQWREKICKHLGVEPQFFDLSMGMSNDYEEAVELGSTNIRVGSMIFGERKRPKEMESNQ